MLFRFKDTLQEKIRFDFIYRETYGKLKFTHCGKTYRRLFIKAAEYMGILSLTEKHLENVKQKAISCHLLEFNSEVYLEPGQTYKMKIFSENSQRILPVR